MRSVAGSMPYFIESTLFYCNLDEDARNAAKVISDLEKKRDAILSTNDSKFYSWKSTWVSYHLKYKAEFERIVRERHSWYCGYLYRSYVARYVLMINLSFQDWN